MDNLPELFTRKDVAMRWGVSERTVTQWINSGRLGCLREGRWIRILREHVEAFENACARPATDTQPVQLFRGRSAPDTSPSEKQIFDRLSKLTAKPDRRGIDR